MTNLKYRVKDMNCVMCKSAIEKALARLSGVTRVGIDLADHTVSIEAEDGIDEEKLARMIRHLGYTPERIT